jgi:hypothetical protein
LDREVRGFLALENAAGIDAGQTIRVRSTASITHRAAGRDELALRMDRENPMAQRQCGEAPGRARLATRPIWTGSLPVVKTMGIAVIAAFIANTPGVFATITAT